MSTPCPSAWEGEGGGGGGEEDEEFIQFKRDSQRGGTRHQHAVAQHLPKTRDGGPTEEPLMQPCAAATAVIREYAAGNAMTFTVTRSCNLLDYVRVAATAG